MEWKGSLSRACLLKNMESIIVEKSITLALSHYSVTFSQFHLTRLNNPGWPRGKICAPSDRQAQIPCSALS